MTTDSTPEEASGEELPSDEDLQEPSTEKEPEEEPQAPKRDDPEPSHEAVGIGVIGQPLTDDSPANDEDPSDAQ